MKRLVVALVLALAAACRPASDPLPPPARPPSPPLIPPPALPERVTDPEVVAFVEAHDLADLFHAAVVVDAPAHGLLLFRAAYDDPRRTGLYQTAFGVRYRGKIGWLDPTGIVGSDPLPVAARKTPYLVEPEDAYLFSDDFDARVRGVDPGIWQAVVAPVLARSPATPRETLLRLLRATAPHLAEVIAEQARARKDLVLLFAMPAGRGWRDAVLDAVEARGMGELTPEQVDDVVRLLVHGAARPALAARLVDDPGVRRDPDLLLFLASRVYPEQYGEARAKATTRLLELPALPDSVFRLAPWWDVRPELIRDPRVRRSVRTLERVHHLDEARYRTLRIEADRLLLTNPATPPELVADVASSIAYNARRCEPLPYPTREHGLLAIRHPAVERNRDIAIHFAYLHAWPELRAAAVLRLTGQPLRESARTPAEAQAQSVMRADAAYRQAHLLAGTHLLRDETRLETVKVTLRQWAAPPRPRPEAAEWLRIVEETPGVEALARKIVEPGERMTRLRRASPFLDLLTPQERNEILAGADCS